jgi:hypothetical protein
MQFEGDGPSVGFSRFNRDAQRGCDFLCRSVAADQLFAGGQKRLFQRQHGQ